MTIRIKRVYDPPTQTDGYRVLVDRIWPRGLRKERAAINLWLKDIAPSTVCAACSRMTLGNGMNFRHATSAN